jgi:hypothetical protein
MTDPFSRFSIEAPKERDDALDPRDDIRERRYEWHSLNSLAPLTELYTRNDLGVHLHVGIRGALDECVVGYWCAVFEASPSIDVEVVEAESPHVVYTQAMKVEHRADCLNDSVLVGVGLVVIEGLVPDQQLILGALDLVEGVLEMVVRSKQRPDGEEVALFGGANSIAVAARFGGDTGVLIVA